MNVIRLGLNGRIERITYTNHNSTTFRSILTPQLFRKSSRRFKPYVTNTTGKSTLSSRNLLQNNQLAVVSRNMHISARIYKDGFSPRPTIQSTQANKVRYIHTTTTAKGPSTKRLRPYIHNSDPLYVNSLAKINKHSMLESRTASALRTTKRWNVGSVPPQPPQSPLASSTKATATSRTFWDTLNPMKSTKFLLRSFKENPMLIVLNTGMVVSLYGVSQPDLLVLRTCSLFAGMCSISFYLFSRPPIWASVFWGSFFFSMNLYHWLKLMSANKTISFAENDFRVFQKCFMQNGMTMQQFENLLEKGKRVSYDTNAVVFAEDTHNDVVMVMDTGSVVYERNGWEYSRLDSSDAEVAFLGEMNFFDRHRTDHAPRSCPYTIRTLEPCEVITWTYDSLTELMSEDKELKNIIMATLARAVARKARSAAVDQSVQSLEKYSSLLQTFTQDGVLDPLEKHTLRTYRKRHGITHDDHIASLQQIGWSHKEYKQGFNGKMMDDQEDDRDLARRFTMDSTPAKFVLGEDGALGYADLSGDRSRDTPPQVIFLENSGPETTDAAEDIIISTQEHVGTNTEGSDKAEKNPSAVPETNNEIGRKGVVSSEKEGEMNRTVENGEQNEARALKPKRKNIESEVTSQQETQMETKAAK